MHCTEIRAIIKYMSKSDLFILQNGSDIRGVAMDGVPGEKITLTNEACLKIGAGFAQWLSIKTKKPVNELKIGIGRDSRVSGPLIEMAVVKGLIHSGTKVIRCGLCTTPAMFMSTVFEQTSYDGAIMITASHLPFNRNGIKFFDKDGGVDHEDITMILEMSLEQDEKQISQAITSDCEIFNLIDLYAEHLKKTICRQLDVTEESKPLSGLKIVVDSGNGASEFFVNKILKPLGADTTGSQFLEPDGMFPNHIPNPENKDAMKSIQEATVKNKADLGLIFDTDVDRMGAVFSDGKEVNRDSLIALICAILAPEYPESTIVTDSVTSDRLTYFLEKELGLKHFRYMRGYKNVINLQKELNESGTVCPLAMETSGHGALLENHYLDDGAYLAVKLITALAKAKKQGKTLESLIEKLPALVEDTELRMKLSGTEFEDYGKAIIREFRERAAIKDYKMPRSYEGVRISFNSEEVQGWILLRLSLHDPVMPLNIEGNRPGDLTKLKKIARELLTGFECLDTSKL